MRRGGGLMDSRFHERAGTAGRPHGPVSMLRDGGRGPASRRCDEGSRPPLAWRPGRIVLRRRPGPLKGIAARGRGTLRIGWAPAARRAPLRPDADLSDARAEP
jgi:hypothetical protein